MDVPDDNGLQDNFLFMPRQKPRRRNAELPVKELVVPKKRKSSRIRYAPISTSWTKTTHNYVEQVTGGKCKRWSTKEKKGLLDALKQFSHQDWDSLCRMVPTRTKEEIQSFMNEMKGGDTYKPKLDTDISWLPVENWLDLSQELVHYEQADLSGLLGRVMSLIGNFSNDFPQYNSANPEMVSGLRSPPDYSKLYLYLASMLDETLTMPELSPLESAVVLDLLHDVGEMLLLSDLSVQRKVMCWKYKMLNHRFDFRDVRSSVDRVRRALTCDFTGAQSSGSNDKNATVSQTAASCSEASIQVAGAKLQSSCAVSSSVASKIGFPSECTNLPRPSGVDDLVNRTGMTSNLPEHGESSPRVKKRGRKCIHDWQRTVEKPKLFSMNPFSVPVHLLKLKSIVEGTRTDDAHAHSSPMPEIALRRIKIQDDHLCHSHNSKPVREALANRNTCQDASIMMSAATDCILRAPSDHRVRAWSKDGRIESSVCNGDSTVVVEGGASGGCGGVPAGGFDSSTDDVKPPCVPVRAYRQVKLADGKVILVPTDLLPTADPQPKSSSMTSNPEKPPTSRLGSRVLVDACETMHDACKSADGGRKSYVQSPFGAPVADCMVPVGTSNTLSSPSALQTDTTPIQLKIESPSLKPNSICDNHVVHKTVARGDDNRPKLAAQCCGFGDEIKSIRSTTAGVIHHPYMGVFHDNRLTAGRYSTSPRGKDSRVQSQKVVGGVAYRPIVSTMRWKSSYRAPATGPRGTQVYVVMPPPGKPLVRTPAHEAGTGEPTSGHHLPLTYTRSTGNSVSSVKRCNGVGWPDVHASRPGDGITLPFGQQADEGLFTSSGKKAIDKRSLNPISDGSQLIRKPHQMLFPSPSVVEGTESSLVIEHSAPNNAQCQKHTSVVVRQSTGQSPVNGRLPSNNGSLQEVQRKRRGRKPGSKNKCSNITPGVRLPSAAVKSTEGVTVSDWSKRVQSTRNWLNSQDLSSANVQYVALDGAVVSNVTGRKSPGNIYCG